MKKLKGFTLIEVIIVMVIFSIIMAGLVQMLIPINQNATMSKVVNEQRNVENSITSYLGENLRYATNLLIVEEGVTCDGVTASSANNAIDLFYKFNPVDMNGNYLVKCDDVTKKIRVICFDGSSDFKNANKNYKGRLISSVPGETSFSFDGSLVNTPATNGTFGTGKQYVAFSNAYYGTGDYYIKIRMPEGKTALQISVNSEYYYSPAKVFGKSSSTANTPTNQTYELRNKSATPSYVFEYLVKNSSGTVPPNSCGITSPTANKRFYFVYTTDLSGLPDTALTDTAPVTTIDMGTTANMKIDGSLIVD